MNQSRSTFALAVRSIWLTILLGIYIALQRHESLTSTWLLATYVLIVIGIAFNVAVVQRRTNNILKAVHRSAGALTVELEGLIGGTRPGGAGVSLIIMAAIIALMVLKPVWG
jgi:hypothetical protein